MMGEILRSYTKWLIGDHDNPEEEGGVFTMVVIVVIVMLRYYSRIL